MKFHVHHHDEAKTRHDTIELAIAEARKRLEPWRDGTDRVVQQDFTPAEIEEGGLYVFVVNDRNEETDAGSLITVELEAP